MSLHPSLRRAVHFHAVRICLRHSLDPSVLPTLSHTLYGNRSSISLDLAIYIFSSLLSSGLLSIVDVYFFCTAWLRRYISQVDCSLSSFYLSSGLLRFVDVYIISTDCLRRFRCRLSCSKSSIYICQVGCSPLSIYMCRALLFPLISMSVGLLAIVYIFVMWTARLRRFICFLHLSQTSIYISSLAATHSRCTWNHSLLSLVEVYLQTVILSSLFFSLLTACPHQSAIFHKRHFFLTHRQLTCSCWMLYFVDGWVHMAPFFMWSK